MGNGKERPGISIIEVNDHVERLARNVLLENTFRSLGSRNEMSFPGEGRVRNYSMVFELNKELSKEEKTNWGNNTSHGIRIVKQRRSFNQPHPGWLFALQRVLLMNGESPFSPYLHEYVEIDLQSGKTIVFQDRMHVDDQMKASTIYRSFIEDMKDNIGSPVEAGFSLRTTGVQYLWRKRDA